MFDAAPAIRAAFESTDRATVRVEPYLGMGLTKTDLYDWHTGWPVLMADVRPDLVVLLLGAWDVPGLGPRPTGPRTTGPPPPGWGATYRTLVQQAAAVLTSGGTSLIWVGLPWVAPIVAAPEQVWAVDRTIATVTRGRPRVTYVDGPAVLAGPDGRFAAFLPDAAGRRVRVRKLDGIHLCPAGAARLAIAVLGALPPEWRLMPASGWEDGAWRTDARYSVAAGCTPS